MKRISALVAALAIIGTSQCAYAQFNMNKMLGAAMQGVQALTLTDQQMAEYVKESVKAMDESNPVAGADDPYTQRLEQLTKGITQANGVPLNFKVYKVKDVNAFACPDGSVRVFSSLMDIMDDDELMGIIGHEIGHVAMHHSKKAFKQELLNGALKDAVASTSNIANKLTQTQLATLGLSFAGAKFSRQQEREADDCGYEFLVANGRNPRGMVKSFEKFLQLEGESGGQSSIVQRMFSSHPDTKERIKRMTKRCEKDGY